MIHAGEAIAAEALRWVGTPFVWQGRSRRGCDCVGLVIGVARACGRPEADSVEAAIADYGRRVPAERLLAGLGRLFDRVAEPAAGDLLLLTVAGKPQHLAIAAGGGRMVHCYARGPQQVRDVPIGRGPYSWARALHSVWRWREVPA